ncbi:hypothetical protein [Flaviaesturariibacter aridisoli]|uniref:Uncharacterized protein n=1 Tax=Flaviaesturariibacter aridisoli TaxID=2545761 RepID=A0A4V2WN71_9BACT|nr:hypothetical protein [Flaviaesturariibacter aridisoli]TCZ74362.1 hypothetical protein E0486_01685 [Flaviaesturariibacter aridisoli]
MLIPAKAAAGSETYQQFLLEQTAATSTSPDAFKLVPFNGYYTWDEVPGAFIAVDTNFVFKGTSEASFQQVDLLFSLDGKSCQRVPFTGTFDGTTLMQSDTPFGNVCATFTRNNTVSKADPTTAVVATLCLSIGEPDTEHFRSITATTYNNPIGYDAFKGTYYDVKAAGKPAALQICDGYQVLFDGGSGAPLAPIQAWVYNMNMYFFYFDMPGGSGRLIMGAGAVDGLICNNMTITAPSLTQRILQTIADPPQPAITTPNPASPALMQFSGYYPVSGKGLSPNAFLCVLGQYVCLEGSAPAYSATIGYSADGSSSIGFMVDTTMEFSGDTLRFAGSGTIPALQLTFTRQYVPGQASLVSITGSIGDTELTGFTLFNPVPLTAFGGVPMTSSSTQEKLTINSPVHITHDTGNQDANGKEIIYDYGTFVYAPLMYILVTTGLNDKPSITLSLGTNGANGNACIVIQDGGKVVTSVYSIPG